MNYSEIGNQEIVGRISKLLGLLEGKTKTDGAFKVIYGRYKDLTFYSEGKSSLYTTMEHEFSIVTGSLDETVKVRGSYYFEGNFGDNEVYTKIGTDIAEKMDELITEKREQLGLDGSIEREISGLFD